MLSTRVIPVTVWAGVPGAGRQVSPSDYRWQPGLLTLMAKTHCKPLTSIGGMRKGSWLTSQLGLCTTAFFAIIWDYRKVICLVSRLTSVLFSTVLWHMNGIFSLKWCHGREHWQLKAEMITPPFPIMTALRPTAPNEALFAITAVPFTLQLRQLPSDQCCKPYGPFCINCGSLVLQQSQHWNEDVLLAEGQKVVLKWNKTKQIKQIATSKWRQYIYVSRDSFSPAENIIISLWC